MIRWGFVHSKGKPLFPTSGPGSPNSKANICRILGAPQGVDVHVAKAEDADVWFMHHGAPNATEAEIKFARGARAKGKKIVLGMTSELKWLNGTGRIAKTGHIYSDLLKEVDLIISEVHPSWKVYGRYQDKVIGLSEPLDHIRIPPQQKTVDFLFVGSARASDMSIVKPAHMEMFYHIAYSIELSYMLLEKDPSYRCTIGVGLRQVDTLSQRYPEIMFTATYPHDTFTEWLRTTNVLINPELRPRGGRAIMWAFYAGVPAVCSSGTFFSNLFPSLIFDRIDLEHMRERSIYALENKEKIMEDAESFAKPFYPRRWLKAIYKRLGLKEQIS